MSGPGSGPPPPVDGPPAAPAPASGTVQGRVSLQMLRDGLLRDGSLVAGLGSLGLGSGTLGSQDLAGLLDSTLQHMQTLPRFGTAGGAELEALLLSSPKFAALPSWDEEAPAPGQPSSNAALALHPSGSGGSSGGGAASNTAMAAFGSTLEAGSEGPVSPGVDQQMGAAALEAAWREVRAAHQLADAGGGAAGGTVMVPQPVPAQQEQQQEQEAPPPRRPRGFGGKKRPGPEPAHEPEAAPPAKHHRSDAEAQQHHSVATFAVCDGGDAAMADAAGAVAAGGNGEAREDLFSPTDVVSGLNRVRLNSMDSSQLHQLHQQQLLQRRQSTATAPAAPAPAPWHAAASSVLAQLAAGTPAGPAAVQPPPTQAAAEPDATAAVRVRAPRAIKAAPKAAAPALAEPAAPAASQAATGAAGAKPRVPSKSHKAVATGEGGVFTSLYRGVTKHKLTGRYEAHFWDSTYVRPNAKQGKRARGRQVYLGGYETEAEAARAYDRAVLAFNGPSAPLNFAAADYAADVAWMAGRSPEEVVATLRRGAVGFARGQSQYRGVTRHHAQGRWEARIGRVAGTKYLYLGSFETAEEAARAYDRACVRYRGARAILNFQLADYQPILDDPESFDPRGGGGAAPPAPGAGGAGEPATRNRGAGTGAARRGRRRKAASSDDETESEDEEMGEAEEEEAEDQGSAHGSAAAGGGVPPGFAQQAGLASLLPGSYFLPLGSGLQQQLGVSLSLAPGASMQSMPAFHPGAAAGAGAGPRLPAIRTRAAQQRQQLGASGGGMGAAGMDLSEVLSPLAASLLSPLGLAGSPSGWKDSPLGSLSAGQLARLLSDSLAAQLASADGGSGSGSGSGSGGANANPLNSSGGLLSPALHWLACGSPLGTQLSGSPAGGSGGVSRRPSGGSLNLSRLFSSVSSEADLLSALQWLDSLDPGQLATLATLDSPRAAGGSAPGAPSSAGAGAGAGTGSSGAAGASCPPSRGGAGPSRLGQR